MTSHEVTTATCPACQGHGEVQHALWIELELLAARCRPGRTFTDLDARAFWMLEGFQPDDPKPARVHPCWTCQGAGVIVRERRA